MEYDWSMFRLRITTQATVQQVYDALSSQQQIEQWFLRSAIFSKATGGQRLPDEKVQPGDSYHWLWYGYDDFAKETGEVFMANGSNHFGFTFGYTLAKPMQVEVTIFQQQGETVIQLVQSNIPTDEKSKASFHIGCMQGWGFYLANLKSVLEGGIDLRNRNVDIKEVINS